MSESLCPLKDNCPRSESDRMSIIARSSRVDHQNYQKFNDGCPPVHYLSWETETPASTNNSHNNNNNIIHLYIHFPIVILYHHIVMTHNNDSSNHERHISITIPTLQFSSPAPIEDVQQLQQQQDENDDDSVRWYSEEALSPRYHEKRKYRKQQIQQQDDYSPISSRSSNSSLGSYYSGDEEYDHAPSPLPPIIQQHPTENEQMQYCDEGSHGGTEVGAEDDNPGKYNNTTFSYPLQINDNNNNNNNNNIVSHGISLGCLNNGCCRFLSRQLPTRKLFSITVIFTFLVFIALAVAIGVVTITDVLSSRNIIRSMGTSMRKTLSDGALTVVSDTVDLAKRSMENSMYLFGYNYNHLDNVFQDDKVMKDVINVLKAATIVDPNIVHMNLVFNDGRFIVWEQTALSQQYRSIVSNVTANYNNNILASATTYGSRNTTQVLARYSTSWTEFNNFWQMYASEALLANVNQTARTNQKVFDFCMSQVITRENGEQVIALSKRLFNDQGEQYVLLSAMLRVNMLKNKLFDVINSSASYVVILDSSGSLVTTSVQYERSNGSPSEAMTLRDTNNRELIALENSVLSSYGNWAALANITRISYYSSTFGPVVARKQEIVFGNRVWYVMISWPDAEWNEEALYNHFRGLAIAIVLSLISLVVISCVSIPVANSIHQIKDCFNRIRFMQLDDPVITRTIESKFLWYEAAELQTSFKSMLNTLKSFQKYVPAYVVNKVVSGEAEANLGLQPEFCTIFFLDIKDFTKLCEELDHKQLVKAMGEAFEEVSNIISDKYDGIIDKYIGDCIMAFWQGEGHELKATQCALECKATLERLSLSWKQRQLPILECRIGINSGHVLMGNFGSSKRFNFTVLGDNVNLASRVEGLNRQYDSTIIITENTLKNLPPGLFLTRKLERVQVKGRRNPTLIYELVKYQSEMTNEDRDNMKRYDQGLEEYFAGNFDKALILFEAIADKDSVLMRKIQQCLDYERLGMTRNWNGILKMDYK